MMESENRRAFLKTACTGITSAVFTGNIRGANDRISGAFIGTGLMGTADMVYAMKQPGVQVVAVCDTYQPFLDQAVATAVKAGHSPKPVRDFREILQDKSIDFVCIATPDHWHAYMSVEACKAGKDVYVEKPVSLVIDEGKQMVAAARRYGRVVQAGTMQRSAAHFRKAVEIVRSNLLGKVTFCRAWTCMNMPEQGIGNPPDSQPPPGLDWDLWLGPAPLRPFNRNRFGADRSLFPYSQFRYFWDYAGGMVTDWGIHLLDIIQMAFDERMPQTITTLGGKFFLRDNRETPDTQQVTYEYPDGPIVVYETRFANRQMMIGRDQGMFEYGITFHGNEATLYLDRTLFRLIPEKGSNVQPAEVKASDNANLNHWADFIQCMRTRQKTTSDIEICHRSTTTSHLGNIALRSNSRLDWDQENEMIVQDDPRRFQHRDHRDPWKISV